MMTNPDFTKLDYTPKVEQPSYADWRAQVEAETGRPAEEFVWQTLEP
ncbi:MAG: hypothetical protein R3E31_16760 [Chloroflexota bacterium]